MGTPDMLGTYGTYQHFSEDGPGRTSTKAAASGRDLSFEGDTAKARLIGPENTLAQDAAADRRSSSLVHRDRAGQRRRDSRSRASKILLKPGQWSRWIAARLQPLHAGARCPTQHVSGICRFYLQEVAPNFRLYVTPINIDPSDPAVQISEPAGFVQEISQQLGLFYTTGFQEDHKARSNGVFTDDEFLAAGRRWCSRSGWRCSTTRSTNYDDGLLFFYFSSSDLQSHMFWWDSDDPAPDAFRPPRRRSTSATSSGSTSDWTPWSATSIDRYGDQATIFVMSDHGFANFGRQFNLNSWLRDYGYPRSAASARRSCRTSTGRGPRAYGLGINGLYLNLKGRERDGIVEPGEQQERLIKRTDRPA